MDLLKILRNDFPKINNILDSFEPIKISNKNFKFTFDSDDKLLKYYSNGNKLSQKFEQESNDLNLPDYSCYRFSKNFNICLNNNNIFYIFTLGLGSFEFGEDYKGDPNRGNNYKNVISNFIESFVKEKIVVIINFDNGFHLDTSDYIIYNKISDKLILNLFIKRYFVLEKDLKLFFDKQNYMIFNYADADIINKYKIDTNSSYLDINYIYIIFDLNINSDINMNHFFKYYFYIDSNGIIKPIFNRL